MTLPDRKYLDEALSYDPISGLLVWRIRPIWHFPNQKQCNAWNAKFSGKIGERDEHPTFSFVIAAARYAPSSRGAEWDGQRLR